MDNNNNQHAITRIETFGVEQIPDHERNATPVDLFRMIFGGANTFATAVLGSFPVLFGLSFQAGLWAILLGVTLGALILAPMGLFGPLNGTNNAVSSGAHFGVHGRIVGSFLSLLTAIAFFSLSVWSSGDALVGGARRLVGLEESELNLGLAYGLFAFAGPFDAAYAGSVQLGQPGFWAAFIGATLLAMSNPISFGAFLGDWARYIPRQTSQARIMLAVIGAQLATLVPFLFGLATATIVAVRAPDYIAANNYVGGLLAIAPGWFFLPVCLIAVIGGMSTGTTSLYGTGLDMSSVFPRLLSRVQATVLIGVASIGFIFVGRFAFNLVQSVSTFAVLIVTCTTPWMVIMLIGLLTRRGFYRPDDLQVFTRGQRGGAYWFEHGWNWRGMGAWIPSAAAGLAFVNLPGQFVGPLGELAGGIDLSLPVALGLAALLYLALLRLFPEPPCVYGPQGPRWVRAHGTRRAPAIATA
ncbi:purine-cytosine permease family protein [Pseudomonas aeruginosa]|nr:cytosine permease [Pseudomonas aeruginosa]